MHVRAAAATANNNVKVNLPSKELASIPTSSSKCASFFQSVYLVLARLAMGVLDTIADQGLYRCVL